MIGVWGFTGDPERALQRVQSSSPDKLVTSLADAATFVVDADVTKAEATPVLSV